MTSLKINKDQTFNAQEVYSNDQLIAYKLGDIALCLSDTGYGFISDWSDFAIEHTRPCEDFDYEGNPLYETESLTLVKAEINGKLLVEFWADDRREGDCKYSSFKAKLAKLRKAAEHNLIAA